jgi:integrase
LRLHVLPVLGDAELAKITTRQVRSWNAAMLNAGRPGAITAAKCYRLLRTILSTAVADEMLFKNPCVIKGAGVEKIPERPVATIDQIYEIADAIEPRFRAVVLTAAFTGLRLGELRALTRERMDLLHSRLKVVEQYQDLANGTLLLCPPKSDAGRRTIATLRSSSPSSKPTWRRSPLPGRVSSSAERSISRSASQRSMLHGRGPSRRWGSRASSSTTSATPATPSPRRPARARRNSWRGWATHHLAPHSSTNTPPKTETKR